MIRFRRALAVLALGGASVAAWFGVGSVVQNVQFARAAQEIELTRQSLQGTGDLSNVYRQVAKVVEPSVVKIDVRQTVRSARMEIPEQFRQFFPDRDGDGSPDLPEDEMLQMGEGSGVIMEVDAGIAYVLTNNHVAGEASEIHVTLADGRVVEGVKLVGSDAKSDLAVLKITVSNVVPARWGNSDELQKGDLICAFGSPFGYVGSMTHGIVSALNRDRVGIIGSEFAYENFIQVDAPINPGNSGGPLVNLKGEVVGINTAIATSTRSFAGIGFAIPVNQAKGVYAQLKDKGKVVRGWLGVQIQDVSGAREEAKATGFTGEHGVIVRSTYKDTPSAGKLRPGDIITAINGKEVQNMAQLRNEIAMTPPDVDVKLTIFRDGKSEDVNVTIAEQPIDMLSRVVPRNGGSNGSPESVTAAVENLGVRLTSPTDELQKKYGLDDAKGALVTAVAANSAAASWGIRPGDLITRVGDKPVSNAREASEALAQGNLAKGVRLYVTNKEGERFVFVKGQ